MVKKIQQQDEEKDKSNLREIFRIKLKLKKKLNYKKFIIKIIK